MKCTACQHDNPDRARFCLECGAAFATQCIACNAEIPPNAKFCLECGAAQVNKDGNLEPATKKGPAERRVADYTPPHIAERILSEQAAMEARGASDGERKTITALFADLKGSTALIEGVDPEDARAIIDPALQIMMDAVHRYDGYVAQALGDGIFALFGAPIAHEDHPQRALYAALRMQEEMRQYSDQIRLKHGAPLAMRVGINTGEVVVRSIRKDDLHTDYVPVGHSTNLAARMEQMATPGSILVTDHTHKLTDGYFEFEALGTAEIKGVEDPLNVFELLGVGQLRTRLQLSARRGLSHFVGRHNEMVQLQQALAQAKDGHGQIVGVLGEPGLGKSRLFYEFKLTSQSGCLVLEAFAVSHGEASPYLPLIELLKDYFHIEPTDDERQRRAKVMGQVLALDKSLEDTIPYLLALSGIEHEDSNLRQMDAQILRTRTFGALKKLLLRESLNQPLILIVEDLHWIDTETQGFLDALTDSLASARVLLLMNYRPEYRHEWGQKTYYTQFRLTPLGKREAQQLLTFLLGTDASLTELKALILDRTEGTPFFMEEVVQTLVEERALVGEQGNYRLARTTSELQISPTVQGVLAARIDRLTPEEKALLQQLSVIGRQFPVSLVKQVVPQSEPDLYRVLASLQTKEYLYERPAFPESEYLFKHALTQEVAYGTVLQEQRKALHESTGRALEGLYRTSLSDHYRELAHHYSHSDNTDKAVEYLGLAGDQAVRRSANEEAVRHFTVALERLQNLPDSAERTQQELALQVALGTPLTVTKGYAGQETGNTFMRAKELCEKVGDTPELFPTLYGLWLFYYVGAEHKKAHEFGEQLLRLAQSRDDSGLLLEAHFALGNGLFCLGEITAARVHVEQGVALYDTERHHVLAFSYGSYDPGVACLCYTAKSLWLLGYPEQALKKSRAALALADDLSHPYSLCWALMFAGWVHESRRESQATRQRAEAAMALAAEQGFPLWAVWGKILRGWGLTQEGQVTKGMRQIREGLADWRAAGAEVFQSYWLALLADAYRQNAQVAEGLDTVAEGLACVARTEERFAEAELHRIKGELRHQAGDRKEAETCFRKAIEIAQQQAAKSWELRAAMSLARLWQGQDKQAEAHKLLSDSYNWFTEGFDTKDLQDAKVLLGELK